jgi:hypothetical protein
MNGSASTTIEAKMTPKVASSGCSAAPAARAATMARTIAQNATPITHSGGGRRAAPGGSGSSRGAGSGAVRGELAIHGP